MSASPIRVLHIGSPTGLYGAERWILALVKCLPDDIQSIIGTIRDAPGAEAEICSQGAALGFRTTIFDAPGRLSRAAAGMMRAYIRDQDIHVLHTHGYKSDIIGALAVRGTRCRLVSTPHGWSTGSGVKLRIYEMLNRVAFGLHDAVVPLSPDIFQGLSRLPWLRRKLHLVPNGVDLEEVDSAPRSGPKADRGFLFGYIGQLIPRKDLATLLRALEALPDAGARLCLIGEGPQRPELEQLARDMGLAGRVDFLGYRGDRLQLLKGFDAFVLSSRLEGIPRCILEAMAARVPVIVSDIPGCTDVVRHGETGLTFPVGDHEALARRMEHVMRNREDAAAMAIAAEHLIRSRYSSAAMASNYAKLYRQLAGIHR